MLACWLSRTSFLLFTTCLFFGCGRGDGPALGLVTGKVTIDDAPLAKAVITYIPEQSGGSVSYGVTNAEGMYTMQFTTDKAGAVIGKHQVTIEPGSASFSDDGKPLPGSVKIPGKYRKPGTLSADVKAGPNVVDFALQSK